MCGIQFFRHFTNFTRSHNHRGASKCSAVDLTWLDADSDRQIYQEFCLHLNTSVSAGGGQFEHIIRYELYEFCCFINCSKLCVLTRNVNNYLSFRYWYTLAAVVAPASQLSPADLTSPDHGVDWLVPRRQLMTAVTSSHVKCSNLPSAV